MILPETCVRKASYFLVDLLLIILFLCNNSVCSSFSVRAIHINKAAISAELKNLPPTSSYSFFIVHHGCIVPLFSNIKISNHNRTDFFIRSKVLDSDSYLHACVLQLHIISTVKQLAA